jgi:hypothetical protein
MKKLPNTIEELISEENSRLRTFSDAFSWRRLKMAIYKLYILILEFSKERIETIFRSIGVALQDLADFSFIFLHI